MMMAKLTRAQRQQIERLQYDLQRAADYIRRNDVVVCARRKMATTTLDYTNAHTGEVLTPMDKEIGSHLVGLFMALESVREMLAAN